MSWQLRVLVMFVLLGLGPREVAAKDVRGLVRLYLEKDGSLPTEPEAEVQLALKTRRVNGTRGVVRVEGHYYRQDLYIKDAFLDHKLRKGLRLQLGINKKILGLEYEDSSRQRLTMHRSNLYQTLEALGLVGRQLELRLLRWPGDGRDGVRADIGLGVDGSRNENALGSLRLHASPVGFGGWGLIEHRHIDDANLMAWAFATSAWLDMRWIRLATELFAGVDAAATDFERSVGDGHQVVFYGPRSEAAVRLPLSRGWALEPFVQGALLAYDARRPSSGYRSQGLGGLNLRSESLVLRSHVEVIAEHGVMVDVPPGVPQRRTLYHASVTYSF